MSKSRQRKSRRSVAPSGPIYDPPYLQKPGVSNFRDGFPSWWRFGGVSDGRLTPVGCVMMIWLVALITLLGLSLYQHLSPVH